MTTPDSTDDVRSDAPLEHLKILKTDGPFELERGDLLHDVQCAYETWGTLNSNASNAILICHAISGDSHAARHHENDEPGWWDSLIGPGKPVDTNRYFVVCPNVLGGCRGSTGPSSTEARTKSSDSNIASGQAARPHGAEFPDITIGDMVRLQKMLADSLGISRWRAIIGGSLGGHQALAWVTTYPGCTQLCVAIATSPRLTSQALGFDVVARNAIQSDPNFADGQYYDRPEKPNTGLAIARMLGHITYLSSEAMDSKFDPDRHDPRQIQSEFEQRFSVGSYLAHQGQKFTTRFDANSYVTLSMAMDLFDLGRDSAALRQSFADCGCEFLIVSFSSDWLFTPQQSLDIVNALTLLDTPVTYAEITTRAGHDAFLIDSDIAQYAPLIDAKLSPDQPALQASDSAASSGSPEFGRIDDWIMQLLPPGASVLDLGCGDGSLLEALRQRGHSRLVGVEVAQDGIHAAAARGLNIIDYDLNIGLPSFSDKQFDVVVLSETLQVVANIQSLLTEMLRVGKQVVVGFSNFAHRTLREDFVSRGRSPRSDGLYGHEWFDTPNRRFPSIADVVDLLSGLNAQVDDAIYLDTQAKTRISPTANPNLNADFAILLASRK
ncbi:MAG: homoserine O-acetyltransferase [Aureliella sp.]